MRFLNSFLTCAGALAAMMSIACAQQSPPASASVAINGQNITIKYSSPRVRGRAGKLFSKDGTIGKDPTYPVWRAGANAATAFHTDADLDLGGLAVPKGNYTLYVDLTNPASWVLIVSKQTGQSGMSYDATQDLGRVKMSMSKPPALVENLKYSLTNEGGNKGKLELTWENHVASVPFMVK